MTRTLPSSPRARRALELVESLQARLVSRLEAIAGEPGAFRPHHWDRDGGRHGGGTRFGIADHPTFGRASVNVSAVHYDDLPDKKLGSATALSTIVHPASPHGPSVHIHISWTEMRDGRGYWRIMADLNPSQADEATDAAKATFDAALKEAAGEHYDHGAAQGDRYFFIPALKRHRGVSHFYLEAFSTGDWEADQALATRVATAAIDTYSELLGRALAAFPTADEAARRRQLAYHTLYLFQVLTLDRGTTSGLLVHNQNDVGILGSLPPRIDRELLASWRAQVPSPQEKLVDALLDALPPGARIVTIDDPTKAALAQAARAHYQAHPEALKLQASGDVVPPTVDNHR